MSDEPSDRDPESACGRAALAGAIVLILAGSGTVGFAIGLALVGMAAVLIVSVFFYEVGRSEDRDRARERQAYGAPHANGL